MKTNTKRLLGIVMLTLSLGIFAGCAAVAPSATDTPVATAAPVTATDTSAPEATATVEATATPQAVTLKEFTAEELAAFDGQNGNKAYVAVDGKVYDVTDVPQWRNGSHAGGSLKAGLDQTEALKMSPHGAKNLENLPIVGLYKEGV